MAKPAGDGGPKWPEGRAPESNSDAVADRQPPWRRALPASGRAGGLAAVFSAHAVGLDFRGHTRTADALGQCPAGLDRPRLGHLPGLGADP